MTLAEAAKTKYSGSFSVVMPYGGNFSAVGCFSFFGGNMNGDSKLGGYCGAYLNVFGARTNGKPLFRRLTLYIHPSNVWVGVFMPKLEVKSKNNRQNCGYHVSS